MRAITLISALALAIAATALPACADEKPVDIDLDDQEPPDRVWSSRQHALITFEEGKLVIEDLNSANGTFVNRARIYPGQKRDLAVGDVLQIGTVQMKLKV